LQSHERLCYLLDAGRYISHVFCHDCIIVVIYFHTILLNSWHCNSVFTMMEPGCSCDSVYLPYMGDVKITCWAWKKWKVMHITVPVVDWLAVRQWEDDKMVHTDCASTHLAVCSWC